MVELTNNDEVDDTIQFIRLISQRPPIFNYQLPIEERKRSAVKRLWHEVSSIMGNSYSVSKCRRKWRNLRDTYHQYRLRKAKLHDNSFHRWRYSKELDFLKDIYKSKPKKNSNKPSHNNRSLGIDQDSQTTSQCDIIVNEDFMDNSQVEELESSSEKYEMDEYILDDEYDDINQEEHLESNFDKHIDLEHNNFINLKRRIFTSEELNNVEQLTKATIHRNEEEIDSFFCFLKLKMSRLPASDITDLQIQFLNMIKQRENAQSSENSCI